MNKKKGIVTAAIIVIGNEILSGRTQDLNVSLLAKWLSNLGINLYEVRIIPDNEKTIVNTINKVRKKYNYVFTTGGIGPTHDDITAKSISRAFKRKYQYNKEAYILLKKYYGASRFTIGRKKMAKTPAGAKLIYNPSSGAPGFYIGNVFSLPGVPSILKSMIGGLTNKLSKGKKTFSQTIHLKTVESEIAISLEKVQKNIKSVEIGSYPFFKDGKIGVSLVLRSVNIANIKKCSNLIKKFIKKKNILFAEEKVV